MIATPVRSPNHGLSRLATRLGLAVALLAALGVSAPTAYADPNDDAFLAALRSQGISFGSTTGALNAAHAVCEQLDHGRTPRGVAREVRKNSKLDANRAGYFTGLSIRVYCPQYAH